MKLPIPKCTTPLDLFHSGSAFNQRLEFDMVRPAVVWAAWHDNDYAVDENDFDNMVIFECAGRGHPWIQSGVMHHTEVTRGDPGDNITVSNSTSMIYPDWDYANDFN